jgi:hypothetical protein
VTIAPPVSPATPLILSDDRNCELTLLAKIAPDRYKVAADRGDASAQVRLFSYAQGLGGLSKDDAKAAQF